MATATSTDRGMAMVTYWLLLNQDMQKEGRAGRIAPGLVLESVRV